MQFLQFTDIPTFKRLNIDMLDKECAVINVIHMPNVDSAKLGVFNISSVGSLRLCS
jgi:hypothetical protein